MKLAPATKENCEQVRLWRNQDLVSWRTPYYLTKEMQENFYKETICNRNSPHRYWGIADSDDVFIGLGGLTDISLENRNAEITLVINPARRRENLGEQAVELILDQAFNYLNLNAVFGEVYVLNDIGYSFWSGMADKYKAFTVALPDRKFWQGHYCCSLYFSFDRDEFEKEKNK